MAHTLDLMKGLLKSNSVYELRNAGSVLCDRLEKTLRVTQPKLCKSLTVTKTVKTETLIERHLPNAIENAVAFIR